MATAGRTRRARGRRRFGALAAAFAVLSLCAVAGATLRQFGFEFSAPHHVRASAATLDTDLQKAIAARLATSTPATVDDALRFALSVTGGALHFGLGHPTKLAFGGGEREGNCIEYAHLFARVFEEAAARGSLNARVYVVHSDRARVLGERVPLRGWGDHDWVLVEDRAGAGVRRLYVDTTLNDLGLGWDIAGNVKGAVHVP